MSNLATTFIYFDTYNYTNTQSTSSYALPFTGFTFRPILDTSVRDKYSIKRIIWNFGDNTIAEAVTASHTYDQPGSYKVTCAVYDSAGNSYTNIFSQVVNVYDFIETSINIQLIDTQEYTLTAGRINTPLNITNSISNRFLATSSDNISIVAYCSGCNNNYFQTGIINKPYGHLDQYSSFYTLETGLNNLTEFVEVSSFKTTAIPLFCKLVDNKIIYTTQDDVNSYFCGISGTKEVYFKNDLSASQVNLMFGYESNTIESYTNTSSIGIKTKITENNDFSELVVNANGMTSEGITSDLFPINKNKFANTKVGFVIKLKDSLNFTNKTVNNNFNIESVSSTETDYNFINSNTISIVLTDNNTIYQSVSFFTNYNYLSSLPYGVYKGYFIADLPYTQNLVLSAKFYDTISNKTITGVSNTFNIYPKDYYNIAKKGEDVDMTQQYKDISFQSLFLDKTVLYDNFFGSIVGNISSRVGDTLGKRTYEKIINFVDNNATLDYSSINSLASITQMIGDTTVRFDSSNYVLPADLGRLVDLLSINFSRLRGSIDSFDQDFKTYGYQDRETYGRNLGLEVGSSYTLTLEKDLVAFEKYSGKFTKVSTFTPICALSASSIHLSSYNASWGWGLVLPDDYLQHEVFNHYLFYEHVPNLSSVLVNGIINYNDVVSTFSQNVTSYSSWSQTDGVISNIITNQLYTGLDLFN